MAALLPLSDLHVFSPLPKIPSPPKTLTLTLNPRRNLHLHLQLLPPCRCSAGTLDSAPPVENTNNDSNPSSDSANPSSSSGLSLRNRRRAVRIAWEKIVRWSRSWRSRNKSDILEKTKKVVVLGGGSFGTAMAAHVASKKPEMKVSMLLRDDYVCQSINETHFNSKYFPSHKLPENIIATTCAKDALAGADFCLHAVPVQFSSTFLESISRHVDPKLPFISLSKGLELNTLRMMSQVIPKSLGNPRQPLVVLSGPSFAVELMNKLPTGLCCIIFLYVTEGQLGKIGLSLNTKSKSLGNPRQPVVMLSGPSFAVELMNKLPTAMVVASKDKKLARAAQQLLASPHLRISTSNDVTGVEIAGALKNVLAIAAGIVEGMNLGNNCMAALVSQGCSEIRWLATKMGAKATTLYGLSGSGDIMLTCFVNLSRNRTVGLRLGAGEKLEDILSSMSQVAEGVSTAGAVIALAEKYNVKMPVLTAVARIIDNELTPKKAVLELMSLPQVEEV